MPLLVYTNRKVTIQLEDTPLAAAGGEGAVYRVRFPNSYANLCAKIYHIPKRTVLRKSKIEFMIHNKPQVVYSTNYVVCWPSEMIFDSSSNFIGFLMPLAFSGSEKLYELTTTKLSKRLLPHWSKFDRIQQSGIEKRLKICVNIAIAVHSIHQPNKYVIVDYKPQNILITNEGKVSIIDVDSFQISDNGAVLFYAEVATPEYAPPESIRINPSKSLIGESWDRFSLAVSFYEILFGIHPFAATCDGQYQGVTTIGEKIQKGLFVHGSKKNYLTVVPSIHNNFQHLPDSLRKLFLRAFEDGHTNSNVRPTSEQWGSEIHSELVKKSGIKGNSIVGPSKANPTPLINKYASNSTPIKNTNKKSTANNTKTKKEDYMIWKIITVVLLVVLIIICIKLSANGAEVNELKNKIAITENNNRLLQDQLTLLRSNQDSSRNNFDSKLLEVQTVLGELAAKYPINLNEITFNDVDKDLNKITTDSHNFGKYYMHYIQPVIKFNSNLKEALEQRIYFKFFNPDGILQFAADSPSGYTWYADVYISGNFEKHITNELSAFSIGCPTCAAGKYKVEIWCNGFLIGESYFNIND